jgi:hypothetical protein
MKSGNRTSTVPDQSIRCRMGTRRGSIATIPGDRSGDQYALSYEDAELEVMPVEPVEPIESRTIIS